MKINRMIGLSGLGALAAVVTLSALPRTAPQDPAANTPALPGDRVKLLCAQRYELDQPYVHYWRKGWPKVSSGWLLVIEAERDMLRPTQAEQPVLYVGPQTAERVNSGYGSGHLVVLAPGDFDLTEAPIFFGDPALPEQVGPTQIERELGRAKTRGVQPPTREHLLSIMQDTLRLDNDYELHQLATDLIEHYAPDEQDLIRGRRAPLVKPIK